MLHRAARRGGALRAGPGGDDHLVVDPESAHILRTLLAQTLGLGENRVRAIAPEVGGGFAAKINIYGEEYVAAALSKRLGLPIKWIEDRSEAFLATVHGRDLIAYVELARHARRQRARAADAHYRRHRRLQHAAHRARADTQHDDGQRELRVSRHPRNADRGLHQQDADRRVSPGGTARGGLLRRAGMDMLARELDIDPAELRRKNFIQPDQFPYRTQMGAVYDSGDYEKVLDRALHLAGWEELQAERDALAYDPAP